MTNLSVCEKTFKLARFLRSHMKTHIPVDQRPFGCVECDSRFVTKQKLKSHFGRIHSQERPEVCHICGKAFPEKAPLHQHLRQHGLVPVSKCEVENCGESFKYSAQLRKHKQAVHGADSSKLKCGLCDIQFEHFVKLKYHIETKHSIDKQIEFKICEICQKQCKGEKLLKSHMKKHSTDRPFSCETCGKTFKYKLSLKLHRNSHEGTKVKEFTCEICGKDLSTKDSLTWHMNTHTGIKPYNCSFCPKQFRQEPNMKSHEKRHREGTYNVKIYVRNIHCDQCDKSYCGKRGLRRHKWETHNENKQSEEEIVNVGIQS